MDAEACYVLTSASVDPAVPETFSPTGHAVSPWGPTLQHAGPVVGLLARAMQRCAPREGTRISRLTTEILGAVPMSDVEVHAWVERPGRRIEMLTAQMRAAGPDGAWRTVARATGWRLQVSETSDVAHRADPPMLPRHPPATQTGDRLPDGWYDGFVGALDLELMTPLAQRGTPTQMWARLTIPLVAGEDTTDFEAAMTIVDIANGVGSRVDPAEWTYMNTEVTIHLFEAPRGPWVGLSAETSVGADGIAMSAATIHGEHGPIGRLAQNVLLERLPR